MSHELRERIAADIDAVLARYGMKICRDDGHALVLHPDRDLYRVLIAPGRIQIQPVADVTADVTADDARRSDWLALTDAERMTLMALCCGTCGTTQLPCFCDPRFDE